MHHSQISKYKYKYEIWNRGETLKPINIETSWPMHALQADRKAGAWPSFCREWLESVPSAKLESLFPSSLLLSLSSCEHERETSVFIMAPPLTLTTSWQLIWRSGHGWCHDSRHLCPSKPASEHCPKCPISDTFFATGLTLKLIAPRDSFHCCFKVTTICSRIKASCTKMTREPRSSHKWKFQSHDL